MALVSAATLTETELSGGGDKTVHTRAETSVDVRPTADVGDDGGEPGGADSLTGEAMVVCYCLLYVCSLCLLRVLLRRKQEKNLFGCGAAHKYK